MSMYQYQATGPSGEILEGQIEAEDLASAVKKIEDYKVILIAIRKLDETTVPKSATNDPVELSGSEAFDIEMQWALEKLDARLSNCKNIIPVLEAVLQESPKSIPKNSCKRLLEFIQSGRPFHEIAQDPQVIDLIPALLKSLGDGTESQQQAIFLEEVSRFVNPKRSSVRRFTYIVMLFGVGIAAMALLAQFIVPIFESMYAEFGLDLPKPTKYLFSLAKFFRQWMPWIGLAGLALCFLISIATRFARRFSILKRLFGTFVAGTTTDLIGMARYSAALAEVLRLEIPLPIGLAVAGRFSGSHFYDRNAENWARDAAVSGIGQSRFAEAMPPLLLAPIRSIEALQSTSTDPRRIEFLRDLADLYLERANQRPHLGDSVVGPVMVIVLGAVIGFFVIALFMPLMRLTTSLA